MKSSSTETRVTGTAPAAPLSPKMGICNILRRVRIAWRRAKGWVFRGGSRKQPVCNMNMGKTDSCEMRKLFGGQNMKK